MNVPVLKINAFTDLKKGGNPAGVVIDAPALSEHQMKAISKKLQVSETAFLFPSSQADYHVRFFSPAVEVDLCGHATIATFFTLAEQGILPRNKLVVTQETKAGILPVNIIRNQNEALQRVMMTQGKPVLKNVNLDLPLLADALKISIHDINTSLPSQIVSTGLFTLPLCVNSFEVLRTMTPDFKKIKDLCLRYKVGSIHVFTFHPLEKTSVYHARNFAPPYGINEDPVTGTANGAVCWYLHTQNLLKTNSVICEQGDIIGRPGRVVVEITSDTVKVGGRATLYKKFACSV